MYKKQIAFFLGLIWLTSLSAFLSFPHHSEPNRKVQDSFGTVQESTSPIIHILGSNYIPKTPPFSIDWSVWTKFNSLWSSFGLEVGETCLQSSFFKKSLPLFDVIVTFIHFFHTW